MISSRIFAKVSAPLGLLVAVLVAPSIGQAQQTKVVVVPYAPLYDSIPRATGDRIASTLEEGIRSNSAIQVVAPPQSAEQGAAGAILATPEQVQAIAAAHAELEKGKGHLERRRMKPALDAFTRAIAGMEATAIALDEIDPLVEAYLKQAVAQFRMGRESLAAEGPLPQAIRLQPSLRLQASEDYDQVFVDLFEKVRTKMADDGVGSLRVDTTPPGAGVWVDGRDAMTSPVLVTGLVPGTHYVKIKLPSTDPYVQKVVIEKDQTFRISPDEGESRQGMTAALVTALSKNEIDADAHAQVKALARQTGADVVVIGGAYAKGSFLGLVSFAYHVAKDSFSELQTITLDRDMLGATIEINKVASELGSKLQTPGEATSLPRPLAADAKAGAAQIHEVDFFVSLSATPPKADEGRRGGAVVPAGDGNRRPVVKPGSRVPVGGGKAPEASVVEHVPEAPVVAVVEEPAPMVEDFLLPSRGEDFGAPAKVEEPAATTYKYTGGVSIADEMSFDEPKSEVRKSEGGLLSKWWFWTAAGVVAGGTVGIIAATSGDSGAGPTGQVSW